jgi:hypothetical protein
MSSSPLAWMVRIPFALMPLATVHAQTCAAPPVELTASPSAVFGEDVDLSGDLLVAGDALAERVTVYERSAGAWTEVQTLTLPPFSFSSFGMHVAIDGQTLAVADPSHGEVHVFERSAGLFATQAVLVAPTGFSKITYGENIALQGDLLVVATPQFGQLHVYRRSGSSWNLEASPTFANPKNVQTSLALDGDTILVGVRGFISATSVAGNVQEFNESGGQWTQGATLVGPNLLVDAFGASVALDGDRFVVGGSNEAFVFERNAGAWSLSAPLLPPPLTGTLFGFDVALAGDVVLVGSPGEPVAGLTTGAVRPFVFAAGQWNADAALYGNPNIMGRLGWSVAMGNTAYTAGNPFAGTGHVLVWGAVAPPQNYCTAGTSGSGCQALLSATGCSSATAAAGFNLIATDVEGAKDGLFFYGASGRQANPWGNGTSLNCVAPPVKRGGLLAGVGTLGVCDGSFAQDLNARWQAKPSHNPGEGATVQAQLWYRDPFSSSNTFTSFSDALEFLVGP